LEKALKRSASDDLAYARYALNGLHAALGPLGWLGLAFLAAAITMAANNCWPLWQQVRDAHRRIDLELQASPARSGLQTRPVASAAPQRFALPTLREAPNIVAAVTHQAAEHEVPIVAAEYRYVKSTDSRPAEYDMSFDLHGSYLDAREFLQDVLEDQPAIGMREVKFYLEEAPGSAASNPFARSPFVITPTPARERELRVHVQLVLFLQESA
jgi:hypothetical protein